MKKLLHAFFAAAMVFCGCSKNSSIIPNRKNSFKISLVITVNDVANNAWQHVLGGKAAIKFTPKGSDTLTTSAVTDSVDLKTLTNYSKQVVSNTYDVTLNTASTAVVDTFIRFQALKQALAIKKDTAITLPATTTDGLITIKKSIIGTGAKPTFKPDNADKAYTFGLANDYYYIYVTGATTGRVTFTEGTSGDLFLKDIAIAAQNQYDLSATLNKVDAVSVSVHSFVSKNNSPKL